MSALTPAVGGWGALPRRAVRDLSGRAMTVVSAASAGFVVLMVLLILSSLGRLGCVPHLA